METLILLAIIFQTTVTLFLGVIFIYTVFKLYNVELNIGRSKEDEFTEVDAVGNETSKVPIEKFIPKKDQTFKVKYSDKDTYTPEK
jgi:hypothetical protein